jgi:hypothetical protein
MHEDGRMTHGEFIYPSYALTIAGLVGTVVWSFVAMRRAESATTGVRRAERATRGDRR